MMRDNRKDPRYPFKKRCYLLYRDNPVMAYTFDISQGGLTVLAPVVELALGDRAKIRFQLDFMQEPVEVSYELRNIINKYEIKDPDVLNIYKEFSVLRYRYGFALVPDACSPAGLKAHEALLLRAKKQFRIMEIVHSLNRDILSQFK